MRAAAVICSLMVFPFLAIGIYCSWVINSAYRESGGGAFSAGRITYMFDGFEHPHKTLIVGGLLASVVIVIVCGITGMVLLRKLGNQAKSQGK